MKKKVIRLTESELVELIKTISEEYDANLDEGLGSFFGRIKNAFAPEIKAVASTGGRGAAKGALATLLDKFGAIKLTKSVKDIIKPIETDLAVLKSDIKRLGQYKAEIPKATAADAAKFRIDPSIHVDYFGNVSRTDNIRRLESQMKSFSDQYNSIGQKGVFDFNHVYENVNDINRTINDLIKSKQITPQGISHLNNMRANIKGIFSNIEKAVAEVASRASK